MRNKMRKRRGKRGFLQLPFSWLFAIIVGAIILFFAIYAATKLIGTETSASSAQTGKEISVLLNPLETSFGEESTTPLTISVDSRLANKCSSFGNFGTDQIIVSQKNAGKWQENTVGPSSENKYIFSENLTEGRQFYLFSKPLDLPFKISDLIYLTSANTNYCFIGAGKDIQSELTSLDQGNLFVTNCPSGSIKVCFDWDQTCDINVDTYQKSVEKNGSTVYFETDALMFGAIFSDPVIYECQVKRLMKRLNELTGIYNDKETLISSITNGTCSTDINLLPLEGAASGLRSSSDLIDVKMASDDAYAANQFVQSGCRLW